MKASRPYHETLLHWIWENRYVSNPSLQATNGKNITVHHPGSLNASDGPDFLNAKITIGNLAFHGDVEIHWSPKDWFNHGHHTDKNYNRVILHVIFDADNKTAAARTDGSTIPTLCLKSFLKQPLQKFFEKFQQPSTLPCAGTISFISPKVFENQLEKAHKEYFEQKVNDLLEFYAPDLTVSKAWQKLVIIALFSGLGITHNREPMQKLARLLLQHDTNLKNKEELIRFALKKAGIDPPDSKNSCGWKCKGSRPNNHPQHRIAQACELLWFIKNRPFSEWLRTDINTSYERCTNSIKSKPGLGQARSKVLYGTVWLPAMYILGDLLGHKKHTAAAYNEWLNHRIQLPASIIKPFKEANIPPHSYRQKLGAVHQLRTYCRPHNCGQCKVFKDVISS